MKRREEKEEEGEEGERERKGGRVFWPGRGEGRERSSSGISYHLGLDFLRAGVKMVV